ncbi:MAG: plasmid pRiA4b ORF-3 family protein [Actinophytocola sp.]|nr:plasmid pRiA4b ORF-3 family protein [Actinophytocola sp.]
MPSWVRSAADVPDLHWPWTAAIAVGLLSVDGKRVTPGSLAASWHATNDEQLMDHWLRAFAGVLATVFPDDGNGEESLEIGRLTLTVLAAEPAPTGRDLCDAIGLTIVQSDPRLYRAFDHGHGVRDPAEIVLEVLAAFGAVTVEAGQHRITSLGRWACQQISDRAAELINDAPAATRGARCQLKISLRYVHPVCWRRIQLPSSATLGELHRIIQIAFDWDDDHLHVFTVGRRWYGNPLYDAEYDEDDITLAEVFTHSRTSIGYIYDLGDTWRHDIILEQTTDADPDHSDPVCLAGRGDVPVEDTHDEWSAFDQAAINARLATLAEGDSHHQLLDDDVQTILTDAYGEAEELTAFLTVLEDEIAFPVTATLLGSHVVVTGLTANDDTLELRARSKGQDGRGTVAFTDLEFPAGTVEAWLHAAYLAYLGDLTSDPVPPAEWDGLWTRWG